MPVYAGMAVERNNVTELNYSVTQCRLGLGSTKKREQ